MYFIAIIKLVFTEEKEKKIGFDFFFSVLVVAKS